MSYINKINFFETIKKTFFLAIFLQIHGSFWDMFIKKNYEYMDASIKKYFWQP